MRQFLFVAWAAILGGRVWAQSPEPLPPPARPDKGDVMARKAVIQEARQEVRQEARKEKPPAPRLETRKVAGTIQTVDGNSRTLVLATANGLLKLGFTPETQWFKNRQPVNLGDFKAGEKVVVVCRPDGGREMVVRVVAAKKETEKKPAEDSKELGGLKKDQPSR